VLLSEKLRRAQLTKHHGYHGRGGATRGQAGAWLQLLRSYLSQCNAVKREYRHASVEGNEIERIRRSRGGASVRVFSCGERSGDCPEVDPAEGRGRQVTEAD
jgi:hypothetical protein